MKRVAVYRSPKGAGYMNTHWETPRLFLISSGTSAAAGVSAVFSENGHQIQCTVLYNVSAHCGAFMGAPSPI